MTTCRDVGDNIRAARRFLVEHGYSEPDLNPSRLVLVGFGRCEPGELSIRDPVQLPALN